jgi:hypothetical protein
MPHRPLIVLVVGHQHLGQYVRRRTHPIMAQSGQEALAIARTLGEWRIEVPMLRYGAQVCALAVFMAGCDLGGFYRDFPLVGPYRLVAIKTSEDMGLCRSVGTKRDCVGDNLPGPTVFQAGADANYIVVARHPREWPKPANRSIAEFYYVIRSANEADPVTPLTVVGPMDKLQYDRESQRLGLPDFTKVFDDLK